jgi:hypothetical protein
MKFPFVSQRELLEIICIFGVTHVSKLFFSSSCKLKILSLFIPVLKVFTVYQSTEIFISKKLSLRFSLVRISRVSIFQFPLLSLVVLDNIFGHIVSSDICVGIFANRFPEVSEIFVAL